MCCTLAAGDLPLFMTSSGKNSVYVPCVTVWSCLIEAPGFLESFHSIRSLARVFQCRRTCDETMKCLSYTSIRVNIIPCTPTAAKAKLNQRSEGNSCSKYFSTVKGVVEENLSQSYLKPHCVCCCLFSFIMICDLINVQMGHALY